MVVVEPHRLGEPLKSLGTEGEPHGSPEPHLSQEASDPGGCWGSASLTPRPALPSWHRAVCWKNHGSGFLGGNSGGVERSERCFGEPMFSHQAEMLSHPCTHFWMSGWEDRALLSLFPFPPNSPIPPPYPDLGVPDVAISPPMRSVGTPMPPETQSQFWCLPLSGGQARPHP